MLSGNTKFTPGRMQECSYTFVTCLHGNANSPFLLELKVMLDIYCPQTADWYFLFTSVVTYYHRVDKTTCSSLQTVWPNIVTVGCSNRNVGRQILNVMSVSWDVTPSSLIQMLRRFRGSCCLNHVSNTLVTTARTLSLKNDSYFSNYYTNIHTVL